MELGDLHVRAFPALHAEGSDLVIRRRGRTDVPPLIVIKAFAAGPRFKPASLARYKAASVFLLDGYHSDLYGGTGRTADWRLARQARRYGPVIVAGGLRPDNVAQAIAEAEPFGIDVASGVEARPGKKDPRAMRALMRQVEAANRG